MRFWENRRARAALFLLLALGYGFSAAHRQLQSGNDFPIYLDAARALLGGESPYSPEPGLNGYVYLPFFALVVSPLAFLPAIVAIWAWYAVNVALTVAAFRLTRGLLEETIGAAHAAWAVWLSLLVHARFFLDNYDMGQANVLMLVLGLWGLRLAIVR
ncbi:MAG: glycosyltransferase family 87 protein, partial [bacterium]